MSYVRIEDVPATWEAYGAIARSVGLRPRGLLLHLAGPTDEGFRIVEVWESELAWHTYEPDLEAALGSIDPVMPPRTAVRVLQAAHQVIGDLLSLGPQWVEGTGAGGLEPDPGSIGG